ncbi:MAG: Fic family protein [Deltaproteobacteria bacterium]|nr:Fic family protein [Deltaproteobacteria bacterium]
MRTYERTHPWINFTLDLRKLDHTTWLRLGEAVSKAEHIAGVPLNPEAAERLHAVYLAKGVLATTAIEGNTLTEDEVRKHLAGHLNLPPSRQYLGREIDNIVTACNFISNEVIQGNYGPITPNEIHEYNKLVLKDLPLNEDVVPGKLRQHSVVVGRYRAAPAEDCEYLLARFCEWMNGMAFPDGLRRACSILSAIAAHLYFVWIHPFGDGNGRTARLIEFRYLLQAGFPTPAAHLLSNFYNLTRAEYYRQLDKASRSDGQMSEFIAYATEGLIDQLREQLQVIRDLQLNATWDNYVYKRFGKASTAHLRQRRLVLSLSNVTENDGWVRVSEVDTLTPKLAQAYANKTAKTLTRDLNAIEQMGLIERSRRLVRANKRLILAFLPARTVV